MSKRLGIHSLFFNRCADRRGVQHVDHASVDAQDGVDAVIALVLPVALDACVARAAARTNHAWRKFAGNLQPDYAWHGLNDGCESEVSIGQTNLGLLQQCDELCIISS